MVRLAKNEPFAKKIVFKYNAQAHINCAKRKLVRVKFFVRIISILVLLVSYQQQTYAQTLDEMRKQADAYFEKGQFVEATPLYSKILAQQPRDYDVNFRYGTCLLYNSHNKSDAIRYLSYAVKGTNIDKRAYFYLGRAYHLNYQFNEAIIQYEKFKQVASPQMQKDFNVDTQIQACKNGKKLLANITSMIVVQKTEIKKEDFYEIYNLNNIGGSIIVTSDFQTKLDKQKGHRPVIHFPANAQAIYYSSYGEDGSTGLDIYVKKRLPDGKYGQAQKVSGGVNTVLDEDYPYMHPDGTYLYFCSKGHNSMGGYDVFRSAYNPSTGTFGPAENLDFAISSPDDDIFFVVDSLDRTAYFSSARESQDGKVFVYQVRVERIPVQIAVIKGNFVNAVNPANKIVSIEIEDFSSGRKIGTFNAKEINGDYLITFPKPGKYKFYITVKGSDDTHVAVVDIPYSKEFRPLKQRITLMLEDNGEQYVKIENLFDELFEDPVAIMAEIYREMSELMPNASQFNLDSLDKMNKNNDVFVEAGLDPFSTKEDVEKVLNDEIKELERSIEQDQKNASIAYNMAEQKSDSANAKMVELNKLLNQVDQETDPFAKKQLLQKIYEEKKVIARMNDEADNLIALGNEIDKSIAAKKNELAQAKKVQNEVKQITSGDKAELANVISQNKTFFITNVKDNTPPENRVDEIIKSNSTHANTTQKLNSEIVALRKEQTDLEKKNYNLNQQLEATKSKKEKAEIEQKILDNTNRIEELKMQVAQKERAYAEAVSKGENSNLGNAAGIVNNPKNATPQNTQPLSDTEKSKIANKVIANNLDANLSLVDKVLNDNGVGGPAIDLFANDEKTKNYSLQQWNDEIDKEINRLKTQRLNATGEEREKIDREIQRYEELKDNKIKEFSRVETDPKLIQPDIRVDDVVKDYSIRKDDINKITNEEQRRDANLKLNEETKNNLIAEKNKLEKLLSENPGSKNIQERINNVNKLISDLDRQTVMKQKEISK